MSVYFFNKYISASFDTNISFIVQILKELNQLLDIFIFRSFLRTTHFLLKKYNIEKIVKKYKTHIYRQFYLT